MGVVYKAVDTRLERFVALKLLSLGVPRSAELRGRFLREARAASTLNDPHICTIYEAGEENGSAFIAMEFLDGVTLQELVKDCPLELDRLIDIALQTIEGMDAAHREGIIHSDIKLANIFITRRGRVKILDFGLATKTVPSHAAVLAAGRDHSESSIDDSELASGLAALGTAPCMSPEQALGKPLDTRTDLFSFGIVLYEMATGKAPFEGDDTGMVFLSILRQRPDPASMINPAVPDALQRIIGKCLEKDREQRYQHAAEIAEDLWRQFRFTVNPGWSTRNYAYLAAYPTRRQAGTLPLH